MATRKHFNQFLEGYTTAALWSSTDDEGEPLDDAHRAALRFRSR